MKKMQKNNKGFSLVELIVVILIMAIIAVALAPQVMKWVDSSRISSDNNNRATLKNSVDAAVADYMGHNGKFEDGKQVVLKLTSTGLAVVDTTDSAKDSIETALQNAVDTVLNKQYPDVKQDKDGYFLITIDDEGSVTVMACDASGKDILSGKDV